jgi:hypothetical protein
LKAFFENTSFSILTQYLHQSEPENSTSIGRFFAAASFFASLKLVNQPSPAAKTEPPNTAHTRTKTNFKDLILNLLYSILNNHNYLFYPSPIHNSSIKYTEQKKNSSSFSIVPESINSIDYSVV